MATTLAASAPVRATTFLVWLLAMGSVVFWAMRLGAPQPPLAPAATSGRSPAPIDSHAIARLLGGPPAAAPGAPTAVAPVATLANRFVLTGVVAARSGGAGAAVLAVDGQPPRPYRVGAVLDERIVLKAVQGRRAVLADRATGETLLTLELPPAAR